jgi:hypothetical protein
LPLKPEIASKDAGDDCLLERTSHEHDKFAEWSEYNMPGFMDDEIHSVDKMPCGKMGQIIKEID